MLNQNAPAIWVVLHGNCPSLLLYYDFSFIRKHWKNVHHIIKCADLTWWTLSRNGIAWHDTQSAQCFCIPSSQFTRRDGQSVSKTPLTLGVQDSASHWQICGPGFIRAEVIPPVNKFEHVQTEWHRDITENISFQQTMCAAGNNDKQNKTGLNLLVFFNDSS